MKTQARYDLIEMGLKIVGAAAFLLGLYFAFNNQPLIGMACWLTAMLLAAGGSYVCMMGAEHQRAEALGPVAGRLGFSYKAAAPVSNLEWPTPAHLHSQRLFQRVFHLMEGDVQGCALRIYDYESESSGEASFRQTVITLQSPNFSLPKFALLPRGSFRQWFSKWLGRPHSAEAIPGYHLIADDPNSPLQLPEAIAPLLNGTLVVESNGSILHLNS